MSLKLNCQSHITSNAFTYTSVQISISDQRKELFLQPRSPDVSKIPKDVVAGMMIDNSNGWGGNFVQMIELRKKILTFRDVIDLPPCDGLGPIHEVFIYLITK